MAELNRRELLFHDCLTDGPSGRPETDPFPREGGVP